MIYDFISSYRPSYLPKTWVFSAQSAEPLRHRHAHDQEVLSGKKTPFPNEKNRMLFCFDASTYASTASMYEKTIC